METPNITLALPKELIYKARHLALERRTSVFGTIDSRAYGDRRPRRWLSRRPAATPRLALERRDLGTGGEIEWRREDLHER